MAADSDRYDGLFLNAAQQCGGIDTLFDAFFGFLARKTDFYVGCKDKTEAEKVMMSSFNKYYEKAVEKRDMERKRNERLDVERKARELAKKKKDEEDYAKRMKKEETKKESDNSEILIEEVEDDVPVGIVKEKLLKSDSEGEDDEKENTKPTNNIKKPSEEVSKKDKKADGEESDDDNSPPPVGNGGSTEKYTWTQTLGTADMHISIKPGTKSRDIGVDIKAGSLKVFYKSSPSTPIIDGQLYNKVKPDDCTWLLLDNKTIHISFEKVDNMKWWSTIIQGDEEIDTKKIVPENSKLSDLDGETRSTVEKMMHDQKMKQLGKPTSDQQKQHDLLESFKKQHPEMDFSKCKINYGGESGGMGNFDLGSMPGMGGGMPGQ